MDLHERQGMRRLATRHVGAGHRRGSQHLRIGIAREPVRHHPAVRVADHHDSRGIDLREAVEVVDQGLEEPDVVVRFPDGDAAARTGVPVAAVSFRIGDDHPALVRERVPAASGFDLLGVTARSVQDDDERHGALSRQIGRHMQQIAPLHTVIGQRLDGVAARCPRAHRRGRRRRRLRRRDDDRLGRRDRGRRRDTASGQKRDEPDRAPDARHARLASAARCAHARA